ncbi:hypothetical protein KKE45_02420 [Patescibacteria group bacterium]|nr:hypothetical protein [Patescibacteria group bacterium]
MSNKNIELLANMVYGGLHSLIVLARTGFFKKEKEDIARLTDCLCESAEKVMQDKIEQIVVFAGLLGLIALEDESDYSEIRERFLETTISLFPPPEEGK